MFRPRSGPKKRTVYHSDGIPDLFFENVAFEKKNQQTTKTHVKLPSRQRVNFSWMILLKANYIYTHVQWKRTTYKSDYIFLTT